MISMTFNFLGLKISPWSDLLAVKNHKVVCFRNTIDTVSFFFFELSCTYAKEQLAEELQPIPDIEETAQERPKV